MPQYMMTPNALIITCQLMSTDLPEDLILKIMDSLPIKSLIRFTCVSKRWKFIILSDPNLAKSQLGHRLLFNSYSKPESGFEYLDLDTLSSSSTDQLIFPFRKPDSPVRILCSCNGLVLTTHGIRDLFLWNPFTKFFKQLLPDPNNYINRHLLRYGFGYLSAADDYKVLIVDHTNRSWTHKLRALIFSLRADTWKPIEFPSDYVLRGEGVLLNEQALHWLNVTELVAFDLATERFRRMPMPALNEVRVWNFRVSNFRHLGPAFRGCLCAFDYSKITTGFIALWIMKEYGVADSWTN